jgi:hypothetical protein
MSRENTVQKNSIENLNESFTPHGKEERQAAQAATVTRPDPKALVEVLYQELGGRWYAFSVVGEKVFYGPVSEGDAMEPDHVMQHSRKRGSGVDQTGTA